MNAKSLNKIISLFIFTLFSIYMSGINISYAAIDNKIKSSCKSRVITIPDNYSLYQKRVRQWMKTCVKNKRAAGLVDNNESLKSTWEKAQEYEYDRKRLYAEYAGDNNVKKINFSLKSPKVQMGNIDSMSVEKIKKKTTSNDIFRSAQAARSILDTNPQKSKDKRAVNVLKCIVDSIQFSYDDLTTAKFDDTIYRMIPLETNLHNPLTCWKESIKGQTQCRSSKGMLQKCGISFIKEMYKITSSDHPISSASAYSRLLNLYYDQIHSGMVYVTGVQGRTKAAYAQKGIKGNNNVLFCPTFKSTILPKLRNTGRRRSIYDCYGDGI